jgi:transcriptional regulator with XRE-family HTH domain
VIWYDVAGSLVIPFSQCFVESSQSSGHDVFYVTFDRGPRDLLEQLGQAAHDRNLTILDCYTWGLGSGESTSLSFYYEDRADYPCRVIRVDEPSEMGLVSETLWGILGSTGGRPRLVFESLTGMRELWAGENALGDFYSQTCPKLYEEGTVSYWIAGGDSLSAKLRSRLDSIAQVVINLSVKRGKTFLTTVKALDRDIAALHKPHRFWPQDKAVHFEAKKDTPPHLELAPRLRQARQTRGVSQAELAKLIGVTPSTISQFENDMIFPSLSTLLNIAQALAVQPGFFLEYKTDQDQQVVFPLSEGREVANTHIPNVAASIKALTPLASARACEIYTVEIPPGGRINSHFLLHKGQEIGCLLAGRLKFWIAEKEHTLGVNDVVHLTTEIPEKWENPGSTMAKLLWVTTDGCSYTKGIDPRTSV